MIRHGTSWYDAICYDKIWYINIDERVKCNALLICQVDISTSAVSSSRDTTRAVWTLRCTVVLDVKSFSHWTADTLRVCVCVMFSTFSNSCSTTWGMCSRWDVSDCESTVLMASSVSQQFGRTPPANNVCTSTATCLTSTFLPTQCKIFTDWWSFNDP